ncbi:MAG: S-layer homology domain-containing protein [Clostridia bacterium]|nr:S-layer homology domain-containing protein [Clostridia bacterium]
MKKIIAVVLCVFLTFSYAAAITGSTGDVAQISEMPAKALVAKVFVDNSSITPSYAGDVATLVEKGILSGYPDGSFKPKNKITRAEFCKMIFAFANCRSTINLGMYQKATSKFTDVQGNASLSWAKGYINYCLDKNIVSGVGNNKFNPQGNITVAAATKMILTALGYDPLIEGLMGEDWQKNTVAKAKVVGLYNGFTADSSAPATREQVCKLINNAFSTYAYTVDELYVETSSKGMKVEDINKFCKAIEGCWVELGRSDLKYGEYEYLLFKNNTCSRIKVPAGGPRPGKIVEIYKKDDLEGMYTLKLYYEAQQIYYDYYPASTEEVKMFLFGNQIVIGRINPLRYTYICRDQEDLEGKLGLYQ